MLRTPVADEGELLRALRQGDEAAFAAVVAQHTPGLLRVVRAHVRDDGAAEEVVQETWLALLRGLGGFEQRSSLQTWLYRVALNRSRTRGARDGRNGTGPVVDPGRFVPDDAEQWPGHWSSPPRPWQRDPQVQWQSVEVLAQLRTAIDALPARQREVVVLRDVEGLTTAEVAQVLELTAGNVRVLLHRGRAGVRTALEAYLS